MKTLALFLLLSAYAAAAVAQVHTGVIMPPTSTPDPITFESTSDDGDPGTVSTHSWSHTLGTLTNGIILVGWGGHEGDDVDRDATSATFDPGGGSETAYTGEAEQVDNTTGNIAASLFYLAGPPDGASFTQQVTLAGLNANTTAGAITLENVDQTTPIGNTTTLDTNSFPASPSVTCSEGSWLVFVGSTDATQDHPPGDIGSSDGTERWKVDMVNPIVVCYTKGPVSAGSQSITITDPNTNLSRVVGVLVEIKRAP